MRREALLLAGAFLTVAAGTDKTFLTNGVTAHRGNAAEYPENTLPAFESALKLGADWIELDVYRTKDGKLAVIHDADTARVGDRTVTVAEVTYDELATVDVAHAFRTEHELSAEACPPQRAPLLEEVLKLITAQHRTRVSIQPKHPIVDEAVELVKRMKAEAWVGFNDGDLNKMKRVKELESSLHVFWDWSRGFELARDLDIARQCGFESIVVHHEALTEDVVKAIKDAALEPGAWTVNDAERMRQLQAMGVFRFYTDCPRCALEVTGIGLPGK
ncbi:MAG TPA: glycerophosphodiester phosphodiesterase family protein [Candidatus Hydrogenedentes bacterium]|nr:glycerophosphodiester phosphodiesterase family protein [Candidatus Hydrogenedentota bacterium]HQH54340.1 glycerophosphodiester phosphodiesterase family protein [Candidatus Hydrogenedentota bacterium]